MTADIAIMHTPTTDRTEVDTPPQVLKYFFQVTSVFGLNYAEQSCAIEAKFALRKSADARMFLAST